VASFERSTHDVDLQDKSVSIEEVGVVPRRGVTHVARRVERKVQSTVGELDEVVLNAFAFGHGTRVDEIGRTKLARPRLLSGIDVDGNHAGRPDEAGRVDAAQTNATATKDGNRRIL
jgi:hypothetical protein